MGRKPDGTTYTAGGIVSRYTAPKDRNPEGDDFGKPWAAPIGTMFNVNGAEVRSIIGLDQRKNTAQPLVIVDADGKWNRGAKDTLVLSMPPGVAREIAAYLTEAADAAERDLAVWKKTHG